jgi:hypothetical protein
VLYYIRPDRGEDDLVIEQFGTGVDVASRRGANLESGWEIRAYQHIRFLAMEAKAADATAALRRRPAC